MTDLEEVMRKTNLMVKFVDWTMLGTHTRIEFICELGKFLEEYAYGGKAGV